MIWSPPNRFAAVSAEELAAAMRAGLDNRRHIAPPPPGPVRIDFLLGPEFERLERLLATSGVRGMPAPSKGFIDTVFRPLRRALKFLANPWLEKQTRFNHESFNHLVHLHDYLTRLAVRVNSIQRDLDNDVLTATRTTNARLNEFFHDVQQFKQLHHDADHTDGQNGNGAVLRPLGSPPVDPLHVIESLFLCSRLPAPPGRVLVLAPVGLHALSLANLGYAVVQYGLAGDTLHHPGLVAHRPGGPAGGALPFDDERFDVVVSMAAEGESARGLAAADPHSDALVAELARVLGPDGVLVGSALVPPGGLTAERVADWVAPFEVRDLLFGHRAGHGWGLLTEPVSESEVALYVAGREQGDTAAPVPSPPLRGRGLG